MSAFTTAYNPGNQGANYAYLIMGPEDDLFHLNAKFTQWRQSWKKYTAHQMAMILQALQNSGLSGTMYCDLIKNTDFLYTSYIVQHFPAIQPNTDAGVTECSWVNCPSLYSIKDLNFKIGSQTMFQTDGAAILLMCDLLGKLNDYAEMIGFCKTRKQLINVSRYDRTLYAPLVGLPFHDRPDLAFSIGAIAFHGVKASLTARPLSEMIINYGSVSKRGYMAIPKQISTGQPIQNNAVQFALGTNCVWVNPDERLSLIHGYNESVFREVCTVGHFQIAPSTQWHRESKPIDVKGPVAFIAIDIKSQEDLLAGNWIKGCQNSGLDWIKEVMLITGSTAIEDGLPASFYRTGKIIEAFKHGIETYRYVFSFETDANSKQMTGHRNLTNSEGVKVSALFAPSASILEITVHAIIYNAWYTENGTGGKIWTN